MPFHPNMCPSLLPLCVITSNAWHNKSDTSLPIMTRLYMPEKAAQKTLDSKKDFDTPLSAQKKQHKTEHKKGGYSFYSLSMNSSGNTLIQNLAGNHNVVIFSMPFHM